VLPVAYDIERMRFFRNALLAALILLMSPFAVKAAEGDSVLLTLDSGFTGRPVELAVFGGGAVVSWDSGVLVRPTTLEIVRQSDGGAHLSFADRASLANGAKIRVALGANEAENAMSVTHDGITETILAASADGMITALVPVSAEMIIVPITDAVSADVEDVRASANQTASVPVPTDETILLTLDQGFVGRPVSLDVFDGELTVAWDDKMLIAPTSLRLTRTRGGAAEDQEEAADGVALDFGTHQAVSSDGVFTITHKAYRPPEPSEHPIANVFGADSDAVQASFAGEYLSYSSAACANAVFVPVYENGIMRSGIASWYRYKNCLCAASPDVPKGTRLKVSRQDDPSRFTVVTVNDYGPDRNVHPDRVIDLDYAAFERIGNPRGGVLAVNVEVLSEDDPLYALGDELP
jgi:hypothetical protein